MNKYQVRTLRAAIKNNNLNWRTNSNFLRESIANIKKKTKGEFRLWDEVTIRQNRYKLYLNSNSSNDLYVITMNGSCIYFTYTHIFAPASSAWAFLTDVYSSYKKDTADQEMRCTEPIKYLSSTIHNKMKEVGFLIVTDEELEYFRNKRYSHV